MSASSNISSSLPVQMPAHKATFHQPPQRALHHPTCRCAQCYLRSTLFPRNERGIILLPRPSWSRSSDSLTAIISPRPRRACAGIRVGNSSREKGKGKEVSTPRARSQSLSQLEGPEQPRSPTWYTNSSVADQHSESTLQDVLALSLTSGDASVRSDCITLPRIQSPRDQNGAGPSQSRSHLPMVSELEPTFHAPPNPSADAPPRTVSKRKLSETFDTVDPTEHVLDFRNSLPPQGREPLRGFPRQRMSKIEYSYSRQGIPDYHAQSYRSHVPKSASQRSTLIRDRNVEPGSSGPSRSRSLSEVGLSSAGAGLSYRSRQSTSSEGQRLLGSPLEEGFVGDAEGQEPTMTGFIALSQNPQPTPAPDKSRASNQVTEDISSALIGDEYEYDDDLLQPSECRPSMPQTTFQTNPIRFREPLTADSRQDRRVVKGGITVIQVKWDSDRKRRQGYFAPDAGSEKSRFRHYSKDDCCFDE